jgi:hypothetical protein
MVVETLLYELPTERPQLVSEFGVLLLLPELKEVTVPRKFSAVLWK